MNFSDTTIFWTNDDSVESLKKLIEVSNRFNWQCIEFFFPVRGAVLLGEMVHVDYRQQNDGGGIYNLNSVYGKGIVNAYIKAEQQNWAGTVVDQRIMDFLDEKEIFAEDFFSDYVKRYKVPYKEAVTIDEEEFVFCLVKGKLNEEAFKNYSNGIKENFAAHGKDVSHPGVKIKLKNTLDYLQSFRESI